MEKKGPRETHQVAARSELLPESQIKLKVSQDHANKSGELFTVWEIGEIKLLQPVAMLTQVLSVSKRLK